ncbi:MAG: hypothetical protein SGPRY_010217, partial [Prymnesium sp.]
TTVSSARGCSRGGVHCALVAAFAQSSSMDGFLGIVAANRRRLQGLRRRVPTVLPPLEELAAAPLPRLTVQLSAVFYSVDFASIFADATPAGRAALLEQATEGSTDWVRARPRSLEEDAPRHARFQAQVDVLVHHQCSLLIPIRKPPARPSPSPLALATVFAATMRRCELVHAQRVATLEGGAGACRESAPLIGADVRELVAVGLDPVVLVGGFPEAVLDPQQHEVPPLGARLEPQRVPRREARRVEAVEGGARADALSSARAAARAGCACERSGSDGGAD